MRVIPMRYLFFPLIGGMLAACAASSPQPNLPPTALAPTAAQPTAPAALGATVAPMTEASQVPLGATVAPRATAPPMQGVPERTRLLSSRTPPLEGEDVWAVQDRLTQLGYASVGQIDGIFGPQTEQAVKDFQIANELEVDGIVGPNTWTQLFSEDAQGIDVHLLVDLEHHYVVGGSSKGQWIAAKDAAPNALASRYTSLAQDGAGESFTGSKPLQQSEDICNWLYEVKPLDGSTPAAPFALGAAWNPLPRPVVELSAATATAELAAPVEATLKTLGLAQPVVNITRALRADVDGDGTQETVVAATFYAHGSAYPAPSADAGDYSLLLLIPAGAATATVVDSEVVKENIEFGAVQMFTLRGLWDLNGDGTLEILSNNSYYEGVNTSVYALPATGPAKVISEGCGV